MIGSGLLLLSLVAVTFSAPQWRFDLKPTRSGIVALESIVVSEDLVLFFDLASGQQPLQINGHSAWGAMWDLRNSSVRPLDVLTDTFCASGALLSNGSMVNIYSLHPVIGTEPSQVSVGGTPDGPGSRDIAFPPGNQALRIFEPCASPSGEGCTLFEDPDNLHLLEQRWYPTAIRIFDGSLFIVGGSHNLTAFYNVDPANSYEFFPRKEDTPRQSAFLERSLPVNLFPRAFALPDGKVFLVANNQSIIYDVETDTERILPDIPNGVRVTNPVDGSAILLPLSPPDYVPEVLVCGGSVVDTSIPSANLSSQHPASSQCSRIKLTEEGIAAGWQVEHMLEPRTMPELVHLPNGQVLIINGGRTGFAASDSVADPINNGSNADHAVFTPSLYTPDAPLRQRINNKGMPTSDIARMYHSSVTLTPGGNFLVAGSNPNRNFTQDPEVKFPSETRVETLDPPYMFVERPTLGSLPSNLQFNTDVTAPITVPANLSIENVQVSLMDLGFSSHAFHSSARLVFMNFTISEDLRSLTFVTPPSGRVYPPGPAFVFLTIDEVSSTGVKVIMGSGQAPPVVDLNQ